MFDTIIMSAPTTEEERILVHFRERVHDVLETEEQNQTTFLIRWLRARDLNINQAEKMLRSSLAWRKENMVDQLLEMPPPNPAHTKNYPYYINGHDKYGHPIVFVPAGKWDFRTGVSESTQEEINHFANYAFESVYHAIRNANKDRNPDLYPVTQFTLIGDWSGLSYGQFCDWKVLQSMLQQACSFEAHYPEIGYRCFLINCPWFISIFTMLMKSIIAAKTYDKVSVYGCDRQVWEQAFREIMDDHQLEQVLKFIL